MLHNDAAQQRPDKKPDSAPEASQKPPRAQGQANLKILTLQRMSNRPGDTTAASLTAGNMDTPHISLIQGRHSPPPRWDPTPHATTPTLPPPRLDLTTHATKPTLHQLYDPTKIVPHQTRLARYYPLREGHEQARPAPALEQGTEPGHLPQYEDLHQNSEQNLQQEKLIEPGLDAWKHPASRADLVTHSMHTVPPATNTPCTHPLRQDNDFLQNSLNTKYQQTESVSWSARHHPFGEGYGQTGTVFGPVQ